MSTRSIAYAFAISLAVSGLFTWLLGRKVNPTTAKPLPQVQCVVSRRALQAGELLKVEDLELAKWAADKPIQGVFSRPEDLAGRAVLYPLEAGQPITGILLSAPGSGPGMAVKIPEGMRAVALRTDEVMGVAGFLVPGSRVDALVTYRPTGAADPVTATVLQDAEVLAAGQKLQPDPEGKPVSAAVVTLLLNAEDSRRAVLASTQGAIHFVLRNSADKQQEPADKAFVSQISSSAAALPVARTRKTASGHHATGPTNYVVELINGDKKSTDVVSGME